MPQGDYSEKRKTESITLDSVEISWLGLKGKWVADRDQQTASWELYVELITRISVVPLTAGTGIVREALSSIYSLFAETRKILKDHGPGVARPIGGGDLTLGYIAVEVLNNRLRPFLAKWHPELQEYEATKPADVSASEHERKWARTQEVRTELEALRVHMIEYAGWLAKAAGIKPLHPTRNP